LEISSSIDLISSFVFLPDGNHILICDKNNIYVENVKNKY
jgi:hypothetical protein